MLSQFACQDGGWLAHRLVDSLAAQAEKEGAQLAAEVALEDAQEMGGPAERPTQSEASAPASKSGSAADQEVAASAFRRRSRSAHLSAAAVASERCDFVPLVHGVTPLTVVDHLFI